MAKNTGGVAACVNVLGVKLSILFFELPQIYLIVWAIESMGIPPGLVFTVLNIR